MRENWMVTALADGSQERVFMGFEPVPAEIRNRQARTMLRRAGLFNQIVEVINQPGNEDLADAWEYELNFSRTSPFVLAMAGALGLTDDQIDDLFIEAAKIQ